MIAKHRQLHETCHSEFCKFASLQNDPMLYRRMNQIWSTFELRRLFNPVSADRHRFQCRTRQVATFHGRAYSIRRTHPALPPQEDTEVCKVVSR